MNAREPLWYCVRTNRGQEKTACESLRGLPDVQVFHPRLRSRTRAIGRLAPGVEPLFPGYIFANFALDPMLPRVTRAAGVKGVLSFMNLWPVVPEWDMEELKRSFGPTQIMDRPARRMDPHLEIDLIAGPLRGFRSVLYYDLPAAYRVNVLIQLLRRSPFVRYEPAD